MNEVLDFLSRHGPSVLFAAVFVEQLGVPLPASPWLLAAGALAADGEIKWAGAIAAGTFGYLVADAIWFCLGRYGGNRVLNFLCRISLEPDSCVRKTQNLFARYGMRSIVLSKFIPGFNTVAAPLAGSSGMSAFRFFVLDSISSLLYAGGLMALGGVFKRQLEQVIAALASLGGGALAVLAAALALYFGYKYFQRYRLLKELRMTRITVDELQEQLKAGGAPIILDVRSLAEVERDPMLILGAQHISLEEIDSCKQAIPPERDVVIYCSCPNEASAARVAQLLRKKGFSRVRPLLGGIDAWRKRNFPLESRVAAAKEFASGDPDSGIRAR